MAFGTSAAIMGGIAGGSSLLGGLFGSNAAQEAARLQAQAARDAAQISQQAQGQSLDFQRQVFNQGQANFAPWLGAGQSGIANLSNLMGLPVTSQVTTPVRQQQMAPFAPPRLTTTEQARLGKLQTKASKKRGGVLKSAGKQAELQTLLEKQNAYSLWDQQYGTGQGTSSGGGGGTAGVPQPGNIFGKTGTDDTGLRLPGPAQRDTSETDALAGGATTSSGDPTSLVNPQLGGFGSLMQPFGEQFQAPTRESLQLDPSFQFRMSEGLKALQNSAAARGTLLTGQTAKDLQSFGQDLASTEYGNAYNRALGEFQQRYNIFENQQANQFNRLAALSGVGQTAGGQLSAAGNQAAGNVGNIFQTGAGQQGQALQNAGAAQASGVVGGANAWQNALNSGVNNIFDLYAMNQGRQNRAVRRPNIATPGYFPGFG